MKLKILIDEYLEQSRMIREALEKLDENLEGPAEAKRQLEETMRRSSEINRRIDRRFEEGLSW